MEKLNCWEFKKCIYIPGAAKELKVCPATTETAHNGKNGGENAGRYCWKVTGTICTEHVKGSSLARLMYCVNCDFFKLVKIEEGLEFQI
jgi:hypothetical protein